MPFPLRLGRRPPTSRTRPSIVELRGRQVTSRGLSKAIMQIALLANSLPSCDYLLYIGKKQDPKLFKIIKVVPFF